MYADLNNTPSFSETLKSKRETPFARTLLDDTTAAEARTTLGAASQADLDSVSASINKKAKRNHLWAGFCSSWGGGNALACLTTQRNQINDGATYARAGFASGVTVYHVNGTHRQDAVRIQRDSGNASTAALYMVMRLTQEESKPLIGQTACLQFHGLKSSTWTGTQITATIQYTDEPEQPILNADGTYTSGNATAGSDTFTLTTSAPALASPYTLSAAIPSTATQVAVVVEVPWSGTAGASDYVELEGMFLTIGSSAAEIIEESAHEIWQKGRTRRQSSYPYGLARGTNTEQGAVSVLAALSASVSIVNWAFAANVRFDPPMAGPPEFFFQSPTSGTESRVLNKNTGSNVNGLAFDLSEKGVTVTHNATSGITAGDRILFHWTAEVL